MILYSTASLIYSEACDMHFTINAVVMSIVCSLKCK